MTERKTISLFLYISEKQEIVLAVRGKDQSHPGLLQATAHGGIQEGEDHADAVERELKEETMLDLPDIGPLTFLGELGAGHKRKEECSYYLAPLTEENAKKLRPTAEVERFTFLRKDALATITPWREKGEDGQELDARTHRVMFPDELEALAMAFSLLEEYHWNPVGGG